MISPNAIISIRKRLRNWGRKNYKNYPWRRPSRQWHGLIAEIMLSRTRAQNVVPVYLRFVARFPEAKDLKDISTQEIETIIYPLGLAWRAPLLNDLCQYIYAHDGKIPDTPEALQKLPAVGTYVSAAMLSLHSNKRAVLVDANVVRFLCRLLDEPMNGETRRKKWLVDLADALTPPQKVQEFNYALLDFTMEICVSKPKCAQCPIGPKLCLHGRSVLKKV